MSVCDPTGMTLAMLYREVPNMLNAKYQPNQPKGSGEEVVWMVWQYIRMTAILNFRSWRVFVKSFINKIWMLNMKFHLNWLSSFIGNVIWIFSWQLQPKLPIYFHKNLIYLISILSSIFLWKISYLAQRVHVSEILRHFPKLPNPLKVSLWSNRNDLSYSYRCPICFTQNISQIGPVVLEKKLFECFFTIYGHVTWICHERLPFGIQSFHIIFI